MFLLTDGASPLLVISASDLTRASECGFGFARALDAKLGRIEAIADEPDAMLERAARLGDAHEATVLDDYRASARVIEIARPERTSREGLRARAAESLAALRDESADIVFQATFFDEQHDLDPERVSTGTSTGADSTALDIAFLGFADFIVRDRLGRDRPPSDGATEPNGDPALWRVQDSKLARRAKVTALLQLAAYAEQVQRLQLGVSDEVDLILGDRSRSIHRLADIAPVYRQRRARLIALIRGRHDDPIAAQWRDARYAHCGKCAWCSHEIESRRDVWQVAGLTGTQWSRLGAAGIETLDELAETPPGTAVDGIGATTLDSLRTQARLQQRARAGEPPPVEWVRPAALAALPDPSTGDIFFDFEGDPLYSEPDASGTPRWGLDYLFGLVEADGAFRAFWAHDHAEEGAALAAFLDYLRERRAQHPDLHVYHYAAYERTHLLSLAARHGIGEDEVDQLLRESVLVDLYPIVRAALRLGSSSYSIKKLEPLYQPDARTGADVADGGASVDEYARAMAAREAGDTAETERMLAAIADYNRVDCVSTRNLRDWLLDAAREHQVPTRSSALDGAEASPVREIEPSPLRESLLALAAAPADPHRTAAPGGPHRTADQAALAYAAAAIDYHRREHKSYWWGHFDRLVAPLADWAETRDVFVVDGALDVDAALGESAAARRSTLDGLVVADWHKTGRQRVPRRHVLLRGTWAPGSRPSIGGRSKPYALYDPPGPIAAGSRTPWVRPARPITLLAAGPDSVTIEETLLAGAEEYDDLPVALTPAPPPDPGQQKPAIEEWGGALVTALTAGEEPDWPRDAMVDLLRRVPPVSGPGATVPPAVERAGGDVIDHVVEHLLALDHSYLAVQGPPGTGKTYLGSHVIARLVTEHGWRVGVVAQGHAVVEHVLDAVIDAGVPAAQVGKAPKDGDTASATARYTVLGKAADLAFFTAEQPAGYVIGGTAWNHSNPAQVARRSLDLLVVDEAGQFSLASTIAASVSARNLLLLGDPQQLPQVSQGTHPEPIDGSALGFLSEGHDVLPGELGYFLAETRRMHPALADVVSALSYESRLHAHPTAETRHLDGIAPGLHPIPVVHHGNATESAEEAAVVVETIRELLGRTWNPGTRDDGTPQGPTRRLTDADIIVVTPYNAQQQLVREHLDAAGLRGARVGTVDTFQGQEAVIAIVSMAASSPHDVPRGMEFLILRNRLTVAISRAEWAAYLVHSPALVDHLPRTPKAVAELSAFLRLLDAGE